MFSYCNITIENNWRLTPKSLVVSHKNVGSWQEWSSNKIYNRDLLNLSCSFQQRKQPYSTVLKDTFNSSFCRHNASDKTKHIRIWRAKCQNGLLWRVKTYSGLANKGFRWISHSNDKGRRRILDNLNREQNDLKEAKVAAARTNLGSCSLCI